MIQCKELQEFRTLLKQASSVISRAFTPNLAKNLDSAARRKLKASLFMDAKSLMDQAKNIEVTLQKRGIIAKFPELKAMKNILENKLKRMAHTDLNMLGISIKGPKKKRPPISVGGTVLKSRSKWGNLKQAGN